MNIVSCTNYNNYDNILYPAVIITPPSEIPCSANKLNMERHCQNIYNINSESASMMQFVFIVVKSRRNIVTPLDTVL